LIIVSGEEPSGDSRLAGLLRPGDELLVGGRWLHVAAVSQATRTVLVETRAAGEHGDPETALLGLPGEWDRLSVRARVPEVEQALRAAAAPLGPHC
jgi:hypothetical protein